MKIRSLLLFRWLPIEADLLCSAGDAFQAAGARIASTPSATVADAFGWRRVNIFQLFAVIRIKRLRTSECSFQRQVVRFSESLLVRILSGQKVWNCTLLL